MCIYNCDVCIDDNNHDYIKLISYWPNESPVEIGEINIQPFFVARLSNAPTNIDELKEQAPLLLKRNLIFHGKIAYLKYHIYIVRQRHNALVKDRNKRRGLVVENNRESGQDENDGESGQDEKENGGNKHKSFFGFGFRHILPQFSLFESEFFTMLAIEYFFFTNKSTKKI